MTLGGGDLESVYRARFAENEVSTKDDVWTEIARWLTRWIPAEAAIVDVACDRGYFVRNVRARERWATDIRDLSVAFDASVRFVQVDGLELSTKLPADHFDVVFMSNYLEHLPSSEAVVHQLREARAVLKPGGRLIVLQPNIRLVGGAYWDFLDHKVALTDRSLAEAAAIAGYRIERLIPRFLPYSTKGRLPQHPALVRAYLAFPPAWRIMGKQALMVARRTYDPAP